MMKTVSLVTAALVLASGGVVATPASAQNYDGDRYGYHDVDRGDYNRDGDRRNDRRYDRRSYDQRGYDNRGYGRRRYRTNRCSSATGTILGAIAGGLLGNTVAGRGDRGVGTVLGAGAGALAGRAIDQSDNPRNCR